MCHSKSAGACEATVNWSKPTRSAMFEIFKPAFQRRIDIVDNCILLSPRPTGEIFTAWVLAMDSIETSNVIQKII